jgi:GST-like protein
MIKLYTWGTGNGLRASVALAESGLAYELHKVDLSKGENKTPEYAKINPAGVIPAIVDTDGPGGKPVALAQSGAILLYVAEKCGKFVPKDPMRRAQAYQWFMQACSDVAGTSGTLFQSENTAPDKSVANIDFFRKRLLNSFVHVDRQLAGREYIADEFSIADLALYPPYSGRKALLPELKNLARWADAMAARPGIQKGMKLN